LSCAAFSLGLEMAKPSFDGALQAPLHRAAHDDEEHAVALANDSEFGLGAAVWTSSISRAHRVARRLRSGVIWVNDHHRNDPSSPWGGFSLSGYGRENGWESPRSYTGIRNVVINLSDDRFDWFESGGEPKRYG
jgi:phenylacetaldehyde dehydrogenase